MIYRGLTFFNDFFLSLVRVQKPFCIDFCVSFSLFARNLSKDERGSFWAKKCRRDHLRSLWWSVKPVTIRRWHRSEGLKEDGEVWICVGLWKSMTDRHSHEGPSCWFIAVIIVLLPKFKRSLSIIEWRPSTTIVFGTVRHTCHWG